MTHETGGVLAGGYGLRARHKTSAAAAPRLGGCYLTACALTRAAGRDEGEKSISIRHDSCRKNLCCGKRAPGIIVKVGIWHYKYKKTTGVAYRRLRSLSFHLWQPGKPGPLRHFE